MLFYKKQPAPRNLYIIRNSHGMEAAFSNYGAKLVHLKVPDKDGNLINIIQEFDREKQCDQLFEPYSTAVIDYLKLGEKYYQLTVNNDHKVIHGEKSNFRSRNRKVILAGVRTIAFTYRPQDHGDDFLGNLTLIIRYTIDDFNKLKIEYRANTDQPIVVNMANHFFFNLNGAKSGTIGQHLLLIRADHYALIDDALIPTGKIDMVKGTPFDFTKPTTIGIRINDNNVQLKNGKGYDHNFLLNRHSRKTLVAKVNSEKGGILMEVFTDQPGLHFYSGNLIKSKDSIAGEIENDLHSAFCLVSQNLADSQAQLAFPLTVLRSGENYFNTIIYCFKSNFCNLNNTE